MNLYYPQGFLVKIYKQILKTIWLAVLRCGRKTVEDEEWEWRARRLVIVTTSSKPIDALDDVVHNSDVEISCKDFQFYLTPAFYIFIFSGI